MEPKINLLVVEDEALIAENLRLSLEDLGYHVSTICYTFAEAERALTAPTLPADLVLLDINLSSADPARSGLALGQLLQERQGPPFLFLTAYSDLDTIREATRLRPSGYLIKPVNNATLFAAIQTALENHQRHQQALPPGPAEVTAKETATGGPPDFFFVKLGDRTHRLLWAEVSALEAGKNYVTLRTAAYKSGYPIRGSLTYVLEQLVPAALRPQFLRVSRSMCLNVAYLTGFDQEYLYCGDHRYENTPTGQALVQAALRQR
ncbi:response regulator transcription factor [Hymenobacter yonginensis]|uniref:Response regulator transcription factor n=1 Tax=Hymenobacter yonginensis TaxID=748197 RepID=A0ABY7PUY8_9BACT|nr:response regulator transcription factor [Hymenobacter yonginensis]WBO86753.1 response regulator transcription factor [Hymenobacter yonginensis]